MSTEQDGRPAGRGAGDERRELVVRAWLCAGALLALLATAGLLAAAGRILFPVALAVLAVFAAVELASTIRRLS